MYNFDRIIHTDSEVVSMYIKLDIPTEFKIKSLTDLPNFKNLMENLKMKVNKSQLARELNERCLYCREGKLFLFDDDTTLSIKNPKKPTKKLLEPINKFSKVADYMITNKNQ